jgi:hypothetical protein
LAPVVGTQADTPATGCGSRHVTFPDAGPSRLGLSAFLAQAGPQSSDLNAACLVGHPAVPEKVALEQQILVELAGLETATS